MNTKTVHTEGERVYLDTCMHPGMCPCLQNHRVKTLVFLKLCSVLMNLQSVLTCPVAGCSHSGDHARVSVSVISPVKWSAATETWTRGKGNGVKGTREGQGGRAGWIGSLIDQIKWQQVFHLVALGEVLIKTPWNMFLDESIYSYKYLTNIFSTSICHY